MIFKYLSVMEKIKTIPEFGNCQEYDGSSLMYLESGVLIRGPEDETLYRMDGAETGFENPNKSTFDESVFYRIEND